MKITRAAMEQADIIGQVHCEAWKQAYAGVFPENFLNEDTSEKRTQEFLASCNSADVFYYIIYEEEKSVGIVKVIGVPDACEIASLYILEQYRNKGYGKQVISYMQKEFDKTRLQLWVLENNKKARHFYESNGFKNTGKKRTIYRGNPYAQIQYELLPAVWAYEMFYGRGKVVTSDIECIPFREEYFTEYMRIYNECFYDMRKALDIEPYNWYSSYKQMENKAENIFVFFKDKQMVGSVACYGNEIDDLIVRKSYQNQGYGKQILLWAINHIKQSNDSEIILHVAEWNEGAVELYKKAGFVVRKKEKVR